MKSKLKTLGFLCRAGKLQYKMDRRLRRHPGGVIHIRIEIFGRAETAV